ncbi:spermidine synthase [Desulfacinum hydrothermale DSM 13146]|uniref:Polyamine aminopropyltransferase n=1 Tax=Desulfacinum hydrothermale DSM 13146 TaxID=1121390 RepID=A0A1W1XM04_9BACT|nr:polyamine aminopropyltransferase [Desulfacinum hydrothermale]SMC24956.1 spermidine synthase [Desulfacinum hydrothermale DSM 13146]
MTDHNILNEPFSSTMNRQFRITRNIHTQTTPFQRVEVVETNDYGITLFLDRRFQTSEKDEFFYHESLVHPAMMTHPDPQRVLIIGGGDGGTLEEALKYPSVQSATMVELDPEVVEIAKTHLRAICGDAFDDPRTRLIIGDGRRFVEETDETFDVIILDLTDPLEPSKYVYTREFYSLCRDRLRPGGILALHNDSPFFYPEAFNVISKTLEAVFPFRRQYLTYIVGYMLDFAFSICSREDVLDVSEKVLLERAQERAIGPLNYYSPQMHARLFALPGYVTRILETPCQISTDAAPYVMAEEDY